MERSIQNYILIKIILLLIVFNVNLYYQKNFKAKKLGIVKKLLMTITCHK